MTTIWNLLKREIDHIKTDKNLISVLLIAPIFYSFFYGSIYFNKVETDVPIVVMDLDHSTTSRKLIRMIDAHPNVAIAGECGNLASAKDKIITNQAQAVLYIPNNLEADLKSGKGSDIKSFLNTSRFLISNDINKAINETAATFNAGIRLKYFQAQGYNFDQAKEIIEPLKVEIRPMFNFTESYGDFMIPSILILILHQTLLLGLSESFAKEREENSISDLFISSRNDISVVIIGKGMFYLLLYSVYALFFFSVNFFVFKLPFNGSYLAFAASSLLMLIAVIFTSIFVSSFFKRKIIAMQFLTLFSYPVFLISGYSWPTMALPVPIKVIAMLIPFTPFSNIVTKVTMMNAGFANVYPQIIHLIILIILFFSAAYYRTNYLLKLLIKKHIATKQKRLV